ncbi:MAG: alpha/beta hydrolase [Proteobacteria bacterium]|nr:alpha/beta hydrolase [Pseudomonadota bacterium]MBU1450777.1 alpha/beta hydrolase [Pseudomonadota bacterium]MBU2469681.1 alpha/beta hydrolase [Pseudomonadota bacterium]
MPGKLAGYLRWKHDHVDSLNAGSQVIDTAKGPVEYAMVGEGGPVVVAVHGGPGGYDQGMILTRRLQNQGFRMLAWSRPGYLRTPISDGRTLSEQADTLAALMDALKIEKAAIMGASAGGPVALAMGYTHPGRVACLISECGVSMTYGKQLKSSQKMFMHLMFNDPTLWLYEQYEHLAPESTLRSFIKLESTLDKEHVEALVKSVEADPARSGYMLDMIGTMCPISLRRDGLENDLLQLAAIDKLPLDKITAPTLVVHGDHDADVPMAHAQNVAQHVAGAELMVIKDGYHLLGMSDQAQEIADRELGFLRTHLKA